MQVPTLARSGLLALVIVAASAVATFESCDGSPEVVTPATGVSYTTLVLQKEGGTGTYYVDNDLCQIECLFSVWVYEESNGVPGLQRSDEVIHDWGCQWPSDTIIF